MYLSHAFNPNKNSLTFIRLFLASLVVFTHSYTLGGFGPDPLLNNCRITFSRIAVEGFFALSGFLIARSFLRSSSIRRYMWHRFLRIFPAFWVCLLVISFVISPVIYYLQHGGFNDIELRNNQFIDYFRSNFLLAINKQEINGVFPGNPGTSAINGSLWTLFPEFLYYLSVPLLSLMALFNKRKKILLLFFGVLLFTNAMEGYLLGYFYAYPIIGISRTLFEMQKLFAYFLGGALLFIYSDKVAFNRSILGILIFTLILSVYLKLYNAIGPLVLPFVIIGLSSVIPFSFFEKYGDYSYGLYIYSFPVQQTIYFLLNRNISSPLVFFIFSLFFSIPLAWLSWHLVEKPCLSLKDK